MKFYEAFVEKALKDPTKLFASPNEVVKNPFLLPEDKQKILEGWEQDQLALMRAEEENMPKTTGAKSPVLLFEKIKKAERSL